MSFVKVGLTGSNYPGTAETHAGCSSSHFYYAWESGSDMGKRIEYQPGDRILGRDGKPTSFTFVKDAGHQKKMRVCSVRCDCGGVHEYPLEYIRSRDRKQCDDCSSKTPGKPMRGKKLQYKPGDIIKTKAGEDSGFVFLRRDKPSGYVYVRCSCGEEHRKRLNAIRSGSASGCPSCFNFNQRIDLTVGERVPFADGGCSDLVFLGRDGVRADRIRVRCSCGKEFETFLSTVRGGLNRCRECADASRRMEFTWGEPLYKASGEFSGAYFKRDIPESTTDGRKIEVYCACGIPFTVDFGNLRARGASCEYCRSRNRHVDLSGKTFGKLRVISIAPSVGFYGGYKYMCQCKCGNSVVLSGNYLLNRGDKAACFACGAERRRLARHIGWEPGDMVGHYEILEEVLTHDQGSCFRVLNTRTGREKTLRQCLIQLYSDEFAHFKHKVSTRLRDYARGRSEKPLRVSGIHLGTREEFDKQLGPCPGNGYHVDHICPISRADTVDEAIALSSFKNLQWLRGSDNLSKSDHWTPRGAELHRELLGREWEKPD